MRKRVKSTEVMRQTNSSLHKNRMFECLKGWVFERLSVWKVVCLKGCWLSVCCLSVDWVLNEFIKGSKDFIKVWRVEWKVVDWVFVDWKNFTNGWNDFIKSWRHSFQSIITYFTLSQFVDAFIPWTQQQCFVHPYILTMAIFTIIPLTLPNTSK